MIREIKVLGGVGLSVACQESRLEQGWTDQGTLKS